MTTYYVDGAVGNDANAGTSAGAGNAWATVNKAASVVVAGDLVNLKSSATYAEKATLTSSGTATNPVRWRGYLSTPGDGGIVTMTGSGSRNACFDLSTFNWHLFEGIEFQSVTTAALVGDVSSASISHEFLRCYFNQTQLWAATSGFGVLNSRYQFCELNNANPNHLSGASGNNASLYYGCYFRSYASTVFPTGATFSNQFPSLLGCVFSNCGTIIAVSNTNRTLGLIDSCIFHGCSSHVFSFTTAPNGLSVSNSIFSNTTGKAVNDSASTPKRLVKCAFYNNSSGDGDIGDALVNYGKIDLTASPYIDPSNHDFSLNNTAGGGALLRAALFPSFPSGLAGGYLDVGPRGHQDSGGGPSTKHFRVGTGVRVA